MDINLILYHALKYLGQTPLETRLFSQFRSDNVHKPELNTRNYSLSKIVENTSQLKQQPHPRPTVKFAFGCWHKFDIETLSLGNAFINCPICLAYNRGSILTMKFDYKSS